MPFTPTYKPVTRNYKNVGGASLRQAQRIAPTYNLVTHNCRGEWHSPSLGQAQRIAPTYNLVTHNCRGVGGTCPQGHMPFALPRAGSANRTYLQPGNTQL